MSRLTPEEISKIDQASEAIRKEFVPMLKNAFDGFLENGFTRKESLTLLIVFMRSTMPSSDKGD